MQRDPGRMAQTHFDVLFIGGGITGATAAYDAALRGLKVALIDKKDFGWATSAATSKLVHGGLRYLQNLEFGLVRESLRERRTLEQIAPHLVLPAPFLVPTYRGSKNNLPLMFAGMLLYDLLSFDKARLDDPARKLPHFQVYSKQRVLREEPGIDPNKLTGGTLYYDCQMHNPERLTLEFVLGATAAGAQAANYTEAVELLTEHNRVVGAKVRDLLDDSVHQIKADVVVNVAGPWADIVSGMVLGEAKKGLIRSQGIHLVFRKVVNNRAVVLRTLGGRHFFLIPWRGKTLAGTTDDIYKGEPDAYRVTRAAAQRFLTEINEVYPSAKVTLDEVTWTFGGLRPIVEEETDVEVEVYDASRKYEIFDHADADKLEGFITVIGGKYTTSRNLAQQLVDMVAGKIGRTGLSCVTAQRPLPGGNIGLWTDFVALGKKENCDVDPAMIEQMSLDYGSLRDHVLQRMTDPDLAARLDERHAIPAATVAVAVEQEMAMTLEDALWRRTALGNTGELSDDAVAKAAAICADRLGWDDARKQREIDHALELLRTRNMIDG